MPLTLYATRAGFDLPDTSPFVIKTEVQLKMAGVAYRKVAAIPPQAPNGKLPYIHDGEEAIGDSTFIRAHIERTRGVDLDRGLDARQRAESWAIERLLEDHLYFAMVWFRWIDPDKRADLHAQGIGRHAPTQIATLGERSIDALARLLGERSYFMGEHPSAVDATALGVLASVATPFFDTPLRRAVEARPNLIAYVARMMQRYYPEHAWCRPGDAMPA
jgi:glutathione S-transferase